MVIANQSPPSSSHCPLRSLSGVLIGLLSRWMLSLQFNISIDQHQKDCNAQDDGGNLTPFVGKSNIGL